MKKIGIFVEGQTERIFVVKFLIEYLGGEHKFSRREIKFKNKNRTELITSRKYPNSELFFLIFDCAGDGNVLPALYERAENMVYNHDFCFLIALQDLYDKQRDKKKLIVDNFRKRIENFSFKDKLRFVLAIMELEAWFLADPNVFSKISKELTPAYIQDSININLLEINPESLPHPSETINKIYKLLSQSYKKTEDQAYQITERLDYDFIYSEEVLEKVKSFKFFIDRIDECLS
ncbi:MAG: DUF4276 family protein [Desulfobacula sp.]|nr:DUF4276 family protein [Desulfobacula sp.]